MRTKIKNLNTIVTMNDQREVLRDSDILIEDRQIKAIGSDLPDADQEIEGKNLIALPGFINTHHHLYQTLQRNVPRVQNAELFDWLTNLYEIWRELTLHGVYTSASVGLAELLLTGCTTTTDHLYLFPEQQPKTLIDEEIRAAADLGIRFHPTRGSMSLGKSQGGLPPDDVVQTEAEIFKDYDRLVDAYHDDSEFSMCRLGLAPCSPFSVTAELLRDTAIYAREKGLKLHTHLAETIDEEDFCMEKVGKRPLAYMQDLGWVGEDVWFAHGIHFNDEELEVLARTKTNVTHCPSSNLRLGSGVARVPEMRAMGINVGLGVDGSASNDSSNMLKELQMALLIHRITQGVHSTDAMGVLEMATRGGATILGRTDIGQLDTGKAADIVLYDLNQIGFAGALHDPVAALLFCGTSQHVHTSIVNGKVLISQGKFLNFDVDKTIAEANKVAAEMLVNAKARTGVDYLTKE